ncbi:MAG: hypothetical protein R2706_14065 [Acidimicrobiales bacterium]
MEDRLSETNSPEQDRPQRSYDCDAALLVAHEVHGITSAELARMLG